MAFEPKKNISRRTVLKGAAGVAAASAVGSFPMPAIAQETTWTLANSLRSVANPYHATFAKGGEDFAKSIGATYEVLVTEGNSEKGIADIRALLQRTGGKLILNVDPNDSPDARVIVEEVQKAGGFVVTQWNKPDDLHPWDHDPNYIAHMSFDGVPTAEAARSAIRQVGLACALTSLTTAIGFGSLLVAESEFVQGFGRGCAIGVVVTFFAVVVFIPLVSGTWIG
ncbi:MAG TPA: twin-arginine translocation signal domain-containing protein, partial [Aestuariivirga sp.]|nr:twin-arginine translocation signal domain-containing protein [Aestuariivirga sp.]